MTTPTERHYWNGIRIFPRADWGQPAESPTTKQTVVAGSTLFVHYSAFGGLAVDSFEEQRTVMQNMHRYHTQSNGWDDLGYSLVAFQPQGDIADQPARLWVGRGVGRIPAAQYGHNTGNLALVVVCEDEAIKDATVELIEAVFSVLPCTKIRGHRDVNATACPGDRLYGRLPEIRSNVPK